MDDIVRDRVRALFEDCVERTLQRLKGEDTHRPFHSALLSSEVVFWSRFERSFSTSFGQAVVEKISKIICDGTGATASECQKDSQVTLTTVQWEEIEAIARDSRGGNTAYKPNWENDLARVLTAGQYGSPDTRRVRTDLFWEKDGIENYMSIKTVKPNLDQTAEAKRDLLKIAAEDPTRNVYFGLYYNPYGDTRNSYKFNPPMRLFNFERDRPILIGKDYWDTLGGTGTYTALLEVASRVGETTRERISGYGLENLIASSDLPTDLVHPGNGLGASLQAQDIHYR